MNVHYSGMDWTPPMGKFRVMVEGRNFLTSRPAGEAKHGFDTTRFVDAPNAEAAEHAAIGQLRARKSLREMVRNRQDDPPMMDATRIDGVASFDGVGSLDQGLACYAETENPPDGGTAEAN
jgi:hypothetical protein